MSRRVAGMLIAVSKKATAPLSVEEEQDLARRYQRTGDQAALSRLVLGVTALIHMFAGKYARLGFDFDDLVSEGFVGATISAQRFDPDLGFRFFTYATYWIQARMQRFIDENNNSVLSMPSDPDAKKVLRALRRGEDPVAVSRRPQSGRAEAIVEAARVSARPLPLDAEIVPFAGGKPMSYADTVADTSPNVLDHMLSLAPVARLRRLIAGAGLTARELELIERRYLAGREATLADVGAVWGVSRERARQIEWSALAKLRAAARGDVVVETQDRVHGNYRCSKCKKPGHSLRTCGRARCRCGALATRRGCCSRHQSEGRKRA